MRRVIQQSFVDDLGSVKKILSCSEPEFFQPREIYFVTINPGCRRGWRMHRNAKTLLRSCFGEAIIRLVDDHENFLDATELETNFLICAGEWFDLENTGNKPCQLLVLSSIDRKLLQTERRL